MFVVKRFNKLHIVSYGRLQDVRNVLGVCIDENISVEEAKKYLDNLFELNEDSKKRVDRMRIKREKVKSNRHPDYCFLDSLRATFFDHVVKFLEISGDDSITKGDAEFFRNVKEKR